jgi:hypothetical protein
MSKVTRRSFLHTSAGVAGGAVIVGAPAAIASTGRPVSEAMATEPSGPLPSEPVMAFVRDAARGEVTLVAGTTEATYRDHELVRRILAAAPGS